jgi:hypothetical protein
VIFASLPWYDLPELREVTDWFWSCLAGNLRERGFKQVPEKINRELPYDQQWTSGRLLFSQACGYDVLLAYRNLGADTGSIAACSWCAERPQSSI